MKRKFRGRACLIKVGRMRKVHYGRIERMFDRVFKRTWLGCLTALSLLAISALVFFHEKEAPINICATIKKLKAKPISLGYHEKVRPLRFVDLMPIGKVNRDGAGSNIDVVLLGALEFKNIAEAVESRYDLPSGLIMAMCCQEAGGQSLLPNGQDDGGIGLCHMQFLDASKYGLKTYKNSKALRDYMLGAELRSLIEKCGSAPKLIEFDDRFHPVYNLDAVGRMMCLYQLVAPEGEDPLSYALWRYSGRRTYADNVRRWMKRLNDSGTIWGLFRHFNLVNSKLTFKGKRIDCGEYLQLRQSFNVNYSLEEYQKLGKFRPVRIETPKPVTIKPDSKSKKASIATTSACPVSERFVILRSG